MAAPRPEAAIFDRTPFLDGTPFAVRVTPRAGGEALRCEQGPPPVLHVRVTAPPDAGRANAAVVALLAKALGVPKTRLELLRGVSSRDKLFRVRP